MSISLLLRRLSGLFLLLIFSGVPLFAQVPQTVTHQGVLEDPGGNPLGGDFELTFRLYDAETDGAVLWEESQNIEIDQGRFSVELGSVEPFDSLGFRRPYWLGISVNTGDELEPRLPLSAVPYSLAARTLAEGAVEAGANVTITRNADHTLVISAAGSEGDGHSLDASDGSPADAVFVDAEGRVGIGRQNPLDGAALSVDGPISFTNRTDPEEAAANPLLYVFESGINNPLRAVFAHSPGFPDWGLFWDDGPDVLRFVGVGETAMSVDLNTGRVGINTDDPDEALSVNGTIESLSGGFQFPDGTVQTTASAFNVSEIGGSYQAFLNRTSRIGSEWFGVRAPISSNNAYGGMYMETNSETHEDGRPFYGYAHNGDFKAWHNYNGSTNDWELYVPNALGSVTRQFRIDGDTGNLFARGSINGGGADLAEAFAVEGATSAYEPGDVLVISTTSDRRVEKSAAPYSTLVAGVYATKPGVVLSEYGSDGAPEDHVPMGVVGVVPTKVSAEGGPIRRGDLLVTSSTPGHAMKADPRELGFGMVLGKALENFDGSGRGTINVLINVK